MKWQDLVLKAFQRQAQELEKVVDGLTQEDLNKQPAPDCNSIGWLVWHVLRSYDRNMFEVMGEEQLWIKDKWHVKFGREPDPGETGFGHTAEQAKNFKSPPAKIVLEYHKALLKKIENYISTRLDEKEIDREYYSPTFNKMMTVGDAVAAQFWHGANHLGAAGYVRGFLSGQGKGKGWYGR